MAYNGVQYTTHIYSTLIETGMPTTSDIKAYMRHTPWVSEWLRCCGKKRMGWRRTRGLTVRLLIGAFIPRSQRGGETNQSERLEMQKGECPKGLEVLRQQSVNGSSHKSSKEGWDNIFRVAAVYHFRSIPQYENSKTCTLDYLLILVY